MSRDVRIPVARRRDGRLVAPVDAQLGPAYTCPECERAVGPRAGKEHGPRRHFFHLSKTVVCALETDKHLLAKYVLARVVLEWLAGRSARPEIVRIGCLSCRAPGPVQPLPDDIDAVDVEKRHAASGRRPDLLLSSGGRLRVAIEVVATHFVDEAKAAALGKLRWCEVLAEDVLADPLRWELVTDHLNEWVCRQCARDARLSIDREQKTRERAESMRELDALESKTRGQVQWALDDAYRCPGVHTYKGPRPGCKDCERELHEIVEDLATVSAPPDWAEPTFIFTARRKPSLRRIADRQAGGGKVGRLIRGYRPHKRKVELP